LQQSNSQEGRTTLISPQKNLPRRHRSGFARAAAGVATMTLAVGVTSVNAVAATTPTTVPAAMVVQAKPALPSGALAVGTVAGASTVQGEVALEPSNPAALAAYASAVSNPSSSLYHHYLSAGQFASDFGPSPTTIAAVTAQLRTDGLAVTSVSGNGLLVSFQATASQAATTFHTGLEDYRLASGRTALAPTSALELPATIAPDVQGVLGLDTLVLPTDSDPVPGATGHLKAAAPATTTTTPGGPTACSAATSDAAANGGLTDTQIADAYGVNGLYKVGDIGAGQTIAVYELEPFNSSDIKTFDTCYFGAAQAAAMASRLHVINVDGGQQTGYGVGEAELDIEDVSALAPGATIEVYQAPDSFGGEIGYLDDFNRIIQDDTAKIVTSSWGTGCDTQIATEDPGLEQTENSIFEQAATQGQTVLVAAGDEGSDGCAYQSASPVAPILSAEDPGSQPYVTSVGGTTITDATDPPTEQVWNDGANFGAGSGGISAVWPAPSWQTDSLVPGIDNPAVVSKAVALNGGPFCGASVCRELPDVSAQADEFTGAITVYEANYGGWTTIGGTSSATPLWAAMLADIDSTQACVAQGGTGFVNPKLYAIASNPAEYQSSFNDITTGNNDTYGAAGGLYPATKGYDMATGLGSPKVTNPNGTGGLAYYLCASATATVPSVTGLSPRAIPTTGGTVTITGNGFEHNGAPDVAGIQIGTYEVPVGDFTVKSPTTISATLPSSASTQTGGSASDGAGTYGVAVTLTDDQTSALSAPNRLIYYAVSANVEIPEVDGVDISGGADGGGNTVTLYGSGFSSGTGTPKVTFGGIAGTGVTVSSDSELTVKVPAYSSAQTVCATDVDPTTDACQAEVQVTTSLGSSVEAPILPDASGATPSDLTTETYPAATEYDYLATPTITGISVETPTLSGTTGTLASEGGGSLAIISGTGLGDLGLMWVNVGNYQLDTSADYEILPGTATQLAVVLPGITPTTTTVAVPVTVQTEASPNVANDLSTEPSNVVDVDYDATPVLTSVKVTKGGSTSYSAGPATGGTTLVIDGSGLSDVNTVEFTDTENSYGASDTTAFTLEKVTSSSVTLLTPPDNPGVDDISVCDDSGCSAPPSSGGVFTYYPVGNPSLTSITPAKGGKGTTVTIDGANLGFVEAVYFGNVKATTFANVPALLDSGSTSQLTATVPAGSLHQKVDVRVETLESLSTGYGKSPTNSQVTFTYTK
jgi:hypothetical protein